MSIATANRMPYGGKEIAELRAAGKRPADMVLVSLIGPLRELNPVVIAKPSQPYDWRFLLDLDVMIVTSNATAQSAVRHVATAINELASLAVLWRADKQDGAWLGRRRAYPLAVVDRIAYAGLGFLGTRDEAMAMIVRTVKSATVANASEFDESVARLAFAGFRSMFGSAWDAA